MYRLNEQSFFPTFGLISSLVYTGFLFIQSSV